MHENDARAALTPVQQAWDVVCEARAAYASAVATADDDVLPNTVATAVHAASALRVGAIADGLQRAARIRPQDAIVGGEDDLGWLVAHAVEARLQLDALAIRLDSPPLVSSLAALDRALTGAGPALRWIPDDAWSRLQELAEALELQFDVSAWWGWRRASEQRFPESTLVDAGRSLSAIQLDRLLGREPALPERFPAAEARLKAAAADGAVSDVAVVPLLCVDRRTLTGLAGTLSIRRRKPGRPGIDPRLGPRARDGLERAFFAAVSLLRDGHWHRSLFEYEVEASIENEHDWEIDGASLALPAGLAFLALFTGRRGAAAAAATGDLRMHQGTWRSKRVDHVVAKRAAWGQVAKEGACVLVACGDEAAARGDGPAIVPNETFADVAEHFFGIRVFDVPRDRDRPDEHADPAWQRSRLAALIDDVTRARLEHHRFDDDSPWVVLADRLQLLIDSMSRAHGLTEPERNDLTRGRIHAALALIHAGEFARAGEILDALDPAALAPGAARLLAFTVRLDNLIDGDDPAATERARMNLEHELEHGPSSPDPGWAGVLGHALGTVGRSYMHARRSEALPWLVRGVEHHRRIADLHPDGHVEVARSRCYLAMALREAGRLLDAAAELRAAEHDLDIAEARASRTYARSTRMYLAYEEARLELASGRVDFALHVLEEAEEAARAAGGPWPLAGILRTRIWALRAQGRLAEAATTYDELRTRIGASTLGVFRRILAEAAGGYRADGEVY